MCNMRYAALLASLAVLAPPAVASETGSGFDSSNDTYAGTICEGLDPHAPASQLLQGRHLLIDELEWAPFGTKDEAAEYGWAGFDIDLILMVQEKLGFTFEISEMGALEVNESYTDLLFRRALQTDDVGTQALAVHQHLGFTNFALEKHLCVLIQSRERMRRARRRASSPTGGRPDGCSP